MPENSIQSFVLHHSRLLVAIILAALAACGTHEAPQDHVGPNHGCNREALVGLRPWLTIRYPLTEKQWPELARLLTAFRSQADFKMVDTSFTNADLRVFEVSLCNDKGTIIVTRQQAQSRHGDATEPSRTSTYLYQRGEFFGWRQLGEALVEKFRRHGWEAEAEWFQPRIHFDGSSPNPSR